MNFMPNDREPVYLQIIRYIKQQVVRRELNPGDTIPSRREMAQLLKVNPNTVQKSYKEMEEMGIINTIKSYQSSIYGSFYRKYESDKCKERRTYRNNKR